MWMADLCSVETRVLEVELCISTPKQNRNHRFYHPVKVICHRQDPYSGTREGCRYFSVGLPELGGVISQCSIILILYKAVDPQQGIHQR